VVTHQVATHERDERGLEPAHQPYTLVVKTEVERRTAKTAMDVERKSGEVSDVPKHDGRNRQMLRKRLSARRPQVFSHDFDRGIKSRHVDHGYDRMITVGQGPSSAWKRGDPMPRALPTRKTVPLADNVKVPSPTNEETFTISASVSVGGRTLGS
jgi:hypothetical protein